MFGGSQEDSVSVCIGLKAMHLQFRHWPSLIHSSIQYPLIFQMCGNAHDMGKHSEPCSVMNSRRMLTGSFFTGPFQSNYHFASLFIYAFPQIRQRMDLHRSRSNSKELCVGEWLCGWVD